MITMETVKTLQLSILSNMLRSRGRVRKRLTEVRTKPPVTGMNAETSAVVSAIPQVINPITMYPNKAPTGPPLAIAWPDAKQSPVNISIPCLDSQSYQLLLSERN